MRRLLMADVLARRRRHQEIERRQHVLVIGVEVERRLADRQGTPAGGRAGRLGGDEVGRQSAARLALAIGFPALFAGLPPAA